MVKVKYGSESCDDRLKISRPDELDEPNTQVKWIQNESINT